MPQGPSGASRQRWAHLRSDPSYFIGARKGLWYCQPEKGGLNMSDSTVRVGMVGLGIAARQVLSSIDATDGAKLTAVCDVRADEAERFKQRLGVETFTSIEDLCKVSAQ